jgi:hypothetical protein
MPATTAAKPRADRSLAKAKPKSSTASIPQPRASVDKTEAKLSTPARIPCAFCESTLANGATYNRHLQYKHSAQIAPAVSDATVASNDAAIGEPRLEPASGKASLGDAAGSAFRQVWQKRRVRVIGIAAALLIVLGVVLGSTLSGSGSSKSGYNDPQKLADSIMASGNLKMAGLGSSATMTANHCIAAGTPHQFTCYESWTDGDIVVTATVTPDGTDWITK